MVLVHPLCQYKMHICQNQTIESLIHQNKLLSKIGQEKRYREEVVVLELGVVVKLGVKVCRSRSGRTNQLNSHCLFLFFSVFPLLSVHQEEKEMFPSFFCMPCLLMPRRDIQLMGRGASRCDRANDLLMLPARRLRFE